MNVWSLKSERVWLFDVLTFFMDDWFASSANGNEICSSCPKTLPIVVKVANDVFLMSLSLFEQLLLDFMSLWTLFVDTFLSDALISKIRYYIADRWRGKKRETEIENEFVETNWIVLQ